MTDRRTLRERLQAQEPSENVRDRGYGGRRVNIDPRYSSGPRLPGAPTGAAVGSLVAGVTHHARPADTRRSGTGEDGLRDRSDAEE